jgi:hypothetical protein
MRISMSVTRVILLGRKRASKMNQEKKGRMKYNLKGLMEKMTVSLATRMTLKKLKMIQSKR